MATTTIAVGECCPTCGRHIPKPRATTTTTRPFPVVTPAPGAEALLGDHVRRRAERRVTSRRARGEHPDDHRLHREHPDLVRFLHEAAAGGRVTRVDAAPERGRGGSESARPFRG